MKKMQAPEKAHLKHFNGKNPIKGLINVEGVYVTCDDSNIWKAPLAANHTHTLIFTVVILNIFAKNGHHWILIMQTH